MSLPLLLIILIGIYIFWHIINVIEKLNAEKIKNGTNPFILEYKKKLEAEKKTDTKFFFGQEYSKKRKKIVFFGLITFAIGFYNFTNLDYDIIKYNGIFRIIFLLILIVSLIFLFLMARDNYLSNKNEFILFKLSGFIVTFVIGGIFFAFYVNIVLISSLNRVIILFPKTELIEKIKVVSKETYNHHGNHYKIKLKRNKGNIEFTFEVDKNTFKTIKEGEKIDFKYYSTKNKTTYLKYGENPYNIKTLHNKQDYERSERPSD